MKDFIDRVERERHHTRSLSKVAKKTETKERVEIANVYSYKEYISISIGERQFYLQDAPPSIEIQSPTTALNIAEALIEWAKVKTEGDTSE